MRRKNRAHPRSRKLAADESTLYLRHQRSDVTRLVDHLLDVSVHLRIAQHASHAFPLSHAHFEAEE